MEEEISQRATNLSNCLSYNLAISGLSAGIYSFFALIEDNVYHGPNKTYVISQLLGEPTCLTPAPLVFITSNFANMVLMLAESISSNRESLANLFHAARYVAPVAVVLVYWIVEARLGGVTTPAIGPDYLRGDIISGAIGGTLSILVTALSDRTGS